MAHSENYSMKDFSIIWKEVEPEIQSADLAFANLEAPVMDSREWSSFPTFNMHSTYVLQTLDSGFDVFSLVNNHSNDQGKEGILSTKKLFEELQREKGIYFSGIKESSSHELNYAVIDKENFKIAFLAVTELLNSPGYKSLLNFIEPNEKGYDFLKSSVKKIIQDEKPDFFVLSIHTSEEEYVSRVSEKRKTNYLSLLENGVDVVWANHPHLIREHDLIFDKESKNLKKLIFYGNGNTISGQRRNPQYDNPYNTRDYTGDGLLFKIDLVKSYEDEGEKIYLENPKARFITTYIDEKRNFILKNLDEAFIEELKENNSHKKANYFTERKKISENTKENIIWQ